MSEKEMTKELQAMGVPDFVLKCPLVFEWCRYKGEVYFGSLNYEKSLEKQKPVIDLHYCATAALNNSCIMKTVIYTPKHFTQK